MPEAAAVAVRETGQQCRRIKGFGQLHESLGPQLGKQALQSWKELRWYPVQLGPMLAPNATSLWVLEATFLRGWMWLIQSIFLSQALQVKGRWATHGLLCLREPCTWTPCTSDSQSYNFFFFKWACATFVLRKKKIMLLICPFTQLCEGRRWEVITVW